MTMFMRMANVTCVCLMAGVALVVTGCERAKKAVSEPQPHAGVWTQPMAGTLLTGLTDDRGLIARCYRVNGESYERLAVPDGCTISPLTAKGRTYLVYDVRSESVVSVGDLQKAGFVDVPKGFECKFAMGNDVYLLKSRSGCSWSVWRPLEGKLAAWPYVPDPEVCVGGIVLARSTRDNSRCAFGFGLHVFPKCEGVTGGTSIGNDDEAVVTLWFETGDRKLYLPPTWDNPQTLQAGEMVMGVKSNAVEIVRNGVWRRIELLPPYERMAEKYRGGKGYAGAYAHLIDKTNGKSFYVVVPNLNRRQSVGELAGPDTLRFDSLQELDLFVKTRLGPYELYSVWDVDSDPTGRYALVK